MGFVARARHFAEHQGRKTKAIPGELSSFSDAEAQAKGPPAAEAAFSTGC
jgi:hypothetical protein